MAEIAHLFGVLAQQHVDQVAHTIALAGAKHCRQGLARRLGSIPGLDVVDAVVTVPARLLEDFIEVGQQRLAAAAGFFAQRQHGIELVLLDALVAFVPFGVLQHLLEHDHVLQAISHPGIGRQAVSPGTAGFLVVGLKRLGQVEVGHEAYVGFVDTHAERDRGDHDQPLFVEEAVLVGGAGFGRQAGMVWQRREALLAKEGGGFVDLLARQAINDAGVATALGKERHQLLARRFLGHDAVEDVRPVEARQEALCALQVQALNDFFAGTHVGGGGKGNARNMREQFGQLAQLQVFGAEVMAPLRNAVGFVDGEQRDIQVAQEVEHARLHQAFGCQVQHFHFATAQAPGQVALLLGRERGVQGGCGYAQLVKRGDLVVHQRDQRRDHHGQAWAQQARHLETQRLAAASRHQHQGIATIGHAFDDRCLAPSETVVAKDVLENALSLFEHVQLQIAVPPCTQAGRKTRPAHAKCVSGFCQAASKTAPG